MLRSTGGLYFPAYNFQVFRVIDPKQHTALKYDNSRYPHALAVSVKGTVE